MSFPRYPEYKDSGVEWLGEVPSHWSARKLKWHLRGNDGGVWGDDPSGSDDTMVLRSTEQTVDGRWQIDDPAYRHLSTAEKHAARLVEGDLLLTKSSGSTLHIGKTTLVTDEIASYHCCYSNFMQRLRPASSLGPKLGWYLLNSGLAREQFDYLSSSTTGLANLNGSVIGELLVPVAPTIAEQTMITAFLDRETAKIDTLVAEQKRLIKLLKEKRQAVISHAVTKGLNPHAPMKDSGVEWLGEVPEHWEVKRLKQVGRLQGGAGFPHEHQAQEGEELPFYKVADISRSSDGRTMAEASNTVSRETAGALRAKIVPPGSVLYAKIGAAMLLNRRRVTTANCCVDNNMTAFIPDDAVIDTAWAYYWLGIIDFGEVANPGAVPSFSEGDQAVLPVLLPPRSEQRSIVTYMDDITLRLKLLSDECLRAIDLLKERRSALISAAVTGKIDVRGLKKAQADEAA